MKTTKRELSIIGSLIQEILGYGTIVPCIIVRILVTAVLLLMCWIYLIADPKELFLSKFHKGTYIVILFLAYYVIIRTSNDIKYWLGK